MVRIIFQRDTFSSYRQNVYLRIYSNWIGAPKEGTFTEHILSTLDKSGSSSQPQCRFVSLCRAEIAHVVSAYSAIRQPYVENMCEITWEHVWSFVYIDGEVDRFKILIETSCLQTF